LNPDGNKTQEQHCQTDKSRALKSWHGFPLKKAPDASNETWADGAERGPRGIHGSKRCEAGERLNVVPPIAAPIDRRIVTTKLPGFTDSP